MSHRNSTITISTVAIVSTSPMALVVLSHHPNSLSGGVIVVSLSAFTIELWLSATESLLSSLLCLSDSRLLILARSVAESVERNRSLLMILPELSAVITTESLTTTTLLIATESFCCCLQTEMNTHHGFHYILSR